MHGAGGRIPPIRSAVFNYRGRKDNAEMGWRTGKYIPVRSLELLYGIFSIRTLRIDLISSWVSQSSIQSFLSGAPV